MPADTSRIQPRRPARGLAAAERGAPLDEIRASALGCRACELWRRATQTVFGEGPTDARIVLIGEQPGDREDRLGRPFVGPAGRILDRALGDAGLRREDVFVTNVVKHFRWRPAPGSKRRLHERPTKAQVAACRPWTDAELATIEPDGVGILGATAAEALLGPGFRITRDRGAVDRPDLAPTVVATIHPSAVLRAGDGDARATAYASLVADLRTLVEAVDAGRRPQRRAG